MAEQNKLSRRGFVKSVAATAGAAALPGYAAAQASARRRRCSSRTFVAAQRLAVPGADPRGAGWLRFLWEKATTRDDWSAAAFRIRGGIDTPRPSS